MNKILIMLLITIIPSLSFCQDQSAEGQSNNHKWEFDVSPYISMASISGDISFLNQSVPINAEFKDILNNLKMAAFLHAEAKNGNWFVMGDLFYVKLSKDGSIDVLSLDTKLEIKQTVAELGGGYTLVNSQDWFYMDGFVGFRYFGIENLIELNSQERLDKTINTTDPFIGVRFRTASNKWISSARFDVGGFGIGSELSWKANIFTGYKFSDLFSVHLGFQGYGIDYEKDNFGLNLTTAGFVTGVNFHF